MYSLQMYKGSNYTMHRTCPICESEDIEFYEQLSSSPYIAIVVEEVPLMMSTMATYYACNSCKTIFQNPHMNEQQIDKYYRSGVYRNTIGLTRDTLMVDEKRRGDEISDFLVKAGIFPKTHLDIGAAHGYLLEKLRERLGTDSKGYDLYGDYQNDAPPEKADLVTSVHVLEHAADPRVWLKQYRELANKWLLLEVPVQCEYRNKRGLRFSHIYSFPKLIVEQLVEAAGFKILISEQKPDTRILAEVI